MSDTDTKSIRDELVATWTATPFDICVLSLERFAVLEESLGSRRYATVPMPVGLFPPKLSASLGPELTLLIIEPTSGSQFLVATDADLAADAPPRLGLIKVEWVTEPMPVPGPGVAGAPAYPIDDYGDLGKLTWLAFKVGDLERRFALPRDRYVTDEDIAGVCLGVVAFLSVPLFALGWVGAEFVIKWCGR
jgi:hypothetical protein